MGLLLSALCVQAPLAPGQPIGNLKVRLQGCAASAARARRMARRGCLLRAACRLPAVTTQSRLPVPVSTAACPARLPTATRPIPTTSPLAPLQVLVLDTDMIFVRSPADLLAWCADDAPVVTLDMGPADFPPNGAPAQGGSLAKKASRRVQTYRGHRLCLLACGADSSNLQAGLHARPGHPPPPAFAPARRHAQRRLLHAHPQQPHL